MNTFDRSDAGREPFALHGLIPSDEIPLSSIQKHEDFIKSIALPVRNFDAVDLALEDEEDDFDPCLFDRPPSCRPKADVDRLLSILDELDGGEG